MQIRRRLVRFASILASILASTLALWFLLPNGALGHRSSPEPKSSFDGLPLAFVPNVGQWDVSAEFVVRRGRMLTRLERRALVVQAERNRDDGSLEGAMVRLGFQDCSDHVQLVGEDQQPGHYNFFLGSDPTQWRREVPVFASVIYRNLYDGIDLRVREGGGSIEYDVLVEPGASLSQFVGHCEGARSLRLDESGALVAETAIGELIMRPPTSWHIDAQGNDIPVPCRVTLLGDNRFTFAVPERRMDLALVVDPILTFSTFVGGSGQDWARDLAVDKANHVLVTGQMNSPNFPSTPGAYRTTRYGVDDAYVLRLTPDGKKLAFATFLGGTAGDTAWGIALDANGAITVTGVTGSTNFPTTTGAFDATLGGPQDVFVTRLTPNGSALIFSTFLGGNGRDWGKKLAVDAAGTTTIIGHTASNNFPTTTGAFDTTHNGKVDCFAARLAKDGKSLVYGTYLGGSEDDSARDVALDAGGTALITGVTSSTNFPTTAGAYDTTHNGLQDGFAAKITTDGKKLVWSTFLGGAANDVANGIAVNRHGIVVVVGKTKSLNYPTTPGVHQTTHSLHDDGFITTLLVNGSILGYSTYLGATRVDDLEDVSIESDGVVTATGNSTGGGLRGTVGAYDPTFNGGWDPIIARMEPNGKLRYLTFFGSNRNDNFRATSLDAANVATFVGNSGSTGFPTTTGAYDTTHNGNNDIVVVRMDLLPTGVRAYGASSPGCDGPLALDVTSIPKIGTPTFAVTCTDAPPSSTGFFGISVQGLTAPIPFQGANLWINPAAPVVFILGARSSSAGAARVTLPIPLDTRLISFKIYTQFVWGTNTTPAPCPTQGVSTSNALEITFQR